MKVTEHDGKTYWEGETAEEKAAIRWVHNNVFFIAGAETYGLNAFQAGIEWARITLKDADAA